MARFMSELLLGLFDGYAAFEEVYWVPDRGPLAGKWTMKKLARRPPRTIRFLVDKNGRFAGIRQRTQFQGEEIDVVIEPEKCFYYSAQEEENAFYGVSYFLPAFYHFDKKAKLYWIAHLAAQARATAGRVGKHPANAQMGEKNAFKQALREFGAQLAMTMPDNYEVDELGAHLATFDFIGLIDHHNAMMSRSVLAQEALDEPDQKPTLVDFSSGGSEMFMTSLESIMDDIQTRINHFITPKFIDWNFASGKYPTWKFGSVSDEQKKRVMAAFDKLSSAASTQVTPDFMFELEAHVAEVLGLPIDYDDLKKEFEEEKKERKEMESAMRKQQTETAKNPPEPAAPPTAGQPPKPGVPKPGKPAPSSVKTTAASDPAVIRLSDIVEQVREDLEATEPDDADQPTD